MKLPAAHETLVAENTEASNPGIVNTEHLENSKAVLSPSEIDLMTLKRKCEDEDTKAK
jgi:hypothetical protein